MAPAPRPDDSAIAPWMDVRALVEDALAVPRDEREAFVRGRAPSPEAAAEALDLLSYAKGETTTERRFESPLAAGGGLVRGAAEADDAARRRLGPWELRRRIGRGGMADVWLAARADGLYRRLVAIKRLHPSIATDEVVARFERERQILANLSHPGIAKMLDAGKDADGVPYIVMEHVDGQRIDEYANERHLSVRDRVRLVARVADAAMAAHRMHVVHRDIKPSNVLVDLEGRPALLDFGVAKVLDPEKDASALVTRDVARFLTPNYASPEQAAGLEPAPTSDVYSLGVLAYELLAGRPPLEIAGRSAFDAAERLAHDVPPRMRDAYLQSPARAEIARSRGTTSAKLAAALGDTNLEAVLAAALRKEPARRPPDAGAFRDELQRWLAGEPVLSRRDSWVRSTLRLAARHRAVFALTGALVLALATGFTLVLGEARRANVANEALAEKTRLAESQLVDLRTATRMLLRDTIGSFTGIPGTEAGLQRLVHAGVEIAKRQRDPELQLLLAQTRFDLEAMDAGRRGTTAEHVEKMEASFRTLARQAGLLGGNIVPSLPHLAVTLAREQLKLGRFDDAERTLESARRDVAGLRPRTRERRLLALGAALDVAYCDAHFRARVGERAGALATLDAALSELEAARLELGFLRQGEFDRAASALNAEESIHREAILALEACLVRFRAALAPGATSPQEVAWSADVTEAVVARHGRNSVVANNAGLERLSSVRQLLAAGRIEEARGRFGPLGEWRRVADPASEGPSSRVSSDLGPVEVRNLMARMRLECELLLAAGEASEETFEELRRVAARLCASDPASYATRYELAFHSYFEGWTLEGLGKRIGAALAYAEAARAAGELAKEAPRDFDIALLRARSEISLAHMLAGDPAFAEREAHVRAALDALRGDEGVEPLIQAQRGRAEALFGGR